MPAFCFVTLGRLPAAELEGVQYRAPVSESNPRSKSMPTTRETHRLLELLELWPRRAISSALFAAAEPQAQLSARTLHIPANRKRAKRTQYSSADVIGYFDPHYPEVLRQIPDPPLVLFFAGNLNLLSTPAVSVVGARRASRVGLNFAQTLGRDLARRDVTVVSGLAYGVDAAAHEGALSESGKTIAILGAGLQKIYPSSHAGLARRIVSSGGLLLTEYPHNQGPRSWQFPERNRIVSGISNGVVVVEASLKSGSLITARLALEQGRDVFAVPGPAHSPVSGGCHALIRQGAELITHADEICQGLGFGAQADTILNPMNQAPSHGQTVHGDDSLLQHLRLKPCGLDELMTLTGESAPELMAKLAPLLAQGIVSSGPGGYIARF